jgi:PPOX class probable F420-dependent enzyme
MTIDANTPLGARAIQRLNDERVSWLVTVTPAGQPQPSPIWHELDLETGTILMYSKPDTSKLRSIAANPRVALHLDGNGRGGDILVVEGRAVVSDEAGADQRPTYVERYRDFMSRNGWSAEDFARMYSVPVRITPTKLRGW